MKAAVLREFNVFPKVEEMEMPEASGEEVVIRQSFTGICYRDILTLKGRFPRTRLPIIPGHEVSGTVEKVGEKVDKFRVGDRVSGLIYMQCGKCKFCTSGRENLCRSKKTLGEATDGSYAPFVKMNQESIVAVPSEVDDESAVIAACVTGMTIQALRNRARLAEDEIVLVTGAGGGVGAHAVQIAKAMGGRVIAATSSEWKREKIHSLGADEVVPSSAISKHVKESTNGQGADVVVETVGSPTFSESLKSLNFGGRLIVIGNVDASTVDLPLGYTILKGIEVIGSVSSTRANVAEALDLCRRGKVKAVIHDKIGLDEVGNAYDSMQKRSSLGRVLIDLSKPVR